MYIIRYYNKTINLVIFIEKNRLVSLLKKKVTGTATVDLKMELVAVNWRT